jgi:hypothetical protein
MNHALLEFSPETEAPEFGEAEWTGEGGAGEVFNEADELELAADLLEVTTESELDRFLGNLIRKAGQAVGAFVSSPTGQALGNILKGGAKEALPVIGRALGEHAGGVSGADDGGSVAKAAGKYFGLELEGLSPEDQEFEAAKTFIRFAGEAAKNAATAPPTAPPQAVAQKAASRAAKRFALGLLRQVTAPQSATQAGLPGPTRTGQWLRRGRNIVIVNC